MLYISAQLRTHTPCSSVKRLPHWRIEYRCWRLIVQGMKERNIEDVHDFSFVLPTLEYHNQIWTWFDFFIVMKNVAKRVVLSQVSIPRSRYLSTCLIGLCRLADVYVALSTSCFCLLSSLLHHPCMCFLSLECHFYSGIPVMTPLLCTQIAIVSSCSVLLKRDVD